PRRARPPPPRPRTLPIPAVALLRRGVCALWVPAPGCRLPRLPLLPVSATPRPEPWLRPGRYLRARVRRARGGHHQLHVPGPRVAGSCARFCFCRRSLVPHFVRRRRCRDVIGASTHEPEEEEDEA